MHFHDLSFNQILANETVVIDEIGASFGEGGVADSAGGVLDIDVKLVNVIKPEKNKLNKRRR